MNSYPGLSLSKSSEAVCDVRCPWLPFTSIHAYGANASDHVNCPHCAPRGLLYVSKIGDTVVLGLAHSIYRSSLPKRVRPQCGMLMFAALRGPRMVCLSPIVFTLYFVLNGHVRAGPKNLIQPLCSDHGGPSNEKLLSKAQHLLHFKSSGSPRPSFALTTMARSTTKSSSIGGAPFAYSVFESCRLVIHGESSSEWLEGARRLIKI